MDSIVEEYILEVVPSPGTNTTDWPSIEKRVELVKPYVKTLHVDIVDGKFAQNTTFMDPKPYTKYAKDLVLEAHLMTDNPLQYVKPFADAGFKRFIGQIEKMPDVAEFVAEAQLLGEVGLAIDGPTSLDALGEIDLSDLDCVLVMMIKAGVSGQAFMPEHLEKVKKLREQTRIPIEVDGGISESTIKLAKESGVTRFVVTSAIYDAPDPKAALENLQKLATS